MSSFMKRFSKNSEVDDSRFVNELYIQCISFFQIEPTKRPTFSDIVTSLEKICNLLKEDSDDQIKRKRKGENIYSLKNSF